MELFSIRIQRTFQLVSTIKIKEIKFEYENHTETKQIKIDAQNITKAILKNTISKEVQLIGKTYMDYKSQMK